MSTMMQKLRDWWNEGVITLTKCPACSALVRDLGEHNSWHSKAGV